MIVPSYSKLAYPRDSAVTESFLKWMKHKELKRYTFSSINEVKLACFKYRRFLIPLDAPIQL